MEKQKESNRYSESFKRAVIEEYLSTQARVRFSKGDIPKLRYRLHSRTFNVAYLQKLIAFKKEKGFQTIERLYSLKEDINKQTYWIWENYSNENMLKNIQTFFHNFPETYDGFINSFFPLFKEELSYFSSFDNLVINLNHGEKNEFLIEYYYLKSTNQLKGNPKVMIFFAPYTPPSPITRKSWNEYAQKGVVINEIRYKLVSASWTAPDFMYEDCPMQYFLAKNLKSRFEAFFEKRIK